MWLKVLFRLAMGMVVVGLMGFGVLSGALLLKFHELPGIVTLDPFAVPLSNSGYENGIGDVAKRLLSRTFKSIPICVRTGNLQRFSWIGQPFWVNAQWKESDCCLIWDDCWNTSGDRFRLHRGGRGMPEHGTSEFFVIGKENPYHPCIGCEAGSAHLPNIPPVETNTIRMREIVRGVRQIRRNFQDYNCMISTHYFFSHQRGLLRDLGEGILRSRSLLLGFFQSAISETGIDSGCDEGTDCRKHEEHLYGIVFMAIGSILALACVCRIYRGDGPWYCGPILIGCFFGIAYGAYLFGAHLSNGRKFCAQFCAQLFSKVSYGLKFARSHTQNRRIMETDETRPQKSPAAQNKAKLLAITDLANQTGP